MGFYNIYVKIIHVDVDGDLMKKKKNWRSLDNTAKIFSVEEKKNTNTFRLTAFMTEKINPKYLKEAVLESLINYPSYRVQLKSGFFWNKFVDNQKTPVVREEPYFKNRIIKFFKSNNYLFRVTYCENMINLDMYHMLTDGLGAIIFFKDILKNYINLKYNLEADNKVKASDSIFSKDKYLEKADKSLLVPENKKKAYLIQEKSNYLRNKTYHFILDLKEVKDNSKVSSVSISEYLSAIYLLALYNTVYDKNSKKDLVLNVPIDLRHHYGVEVYSNFFTCVSLSADIDNGNKVSFKYLLQQMKKEYREKITAQKVEQYLARDVVMGTNIAVNASPLFVKKFFMKYLGKLVSQSTTTTFSNLGIISLEEEYQKYIDNIVTIVNAGKYQKIKCTVCTFKNNLTVTINSNLFNDDFEKEFYKLLKKYAGKVEIKNNEFLKGRKR